MIEKVIGRRQREVIDLLLKDGLLTQDLLDKARDEAKRTGLSMERTLEKLGFVTSEDVVKVKANALGLPYVDLNDYVIDAQLVKVIPEYVAQKYKVIPLFKIANSLTVGMVDPQDIMALDQVRRISQAEHVETVLVSEKGLQRVLDFYYQTTNSITELVRSIDNDKIKEAEKKGLIEAAEEAPIIKLVNMVVTQAVKEKASDIHFEPEPDGLRLRLRIDGILHEMTVIPKKLQNVIISRIKILAKMDIAENRKPQDGRIWLKVENRDLDIRVSSFPTIHGENIVMRLLDKAAVMFGLKKMGMLDQDIAVFDKLIHRPNGIILVTGPTGSGKTSTLYTALSTISSMEKNIITIEDPVEYELVLVRQTEVNVKAGITFANGLRSILRQDPDIIMVGEIRDKETADVAVQAALTGHLVFSTLHTNDAPSSLARLTDMGIEPFLLSSSVAGVIAQRLVRVICEKCKERYKPESAFLRELGLPLSVELYRGKGCGYCRGTGYAGRTAIYEILNINEAIRKLIENKSSADIIKKKAVESGMKTLREDGLIKMQQGITTASEVLRVTELEN